MDFYGPPLPPGFKKEESDSEDDTQPKQDFSSELSSKAIIGPALPAFISRKRYSSDSDEEQLSQDKRIKSSEPSGTIGPVLPPELLKSSNAEDSDSDQPFGPVPISCGPSNSDNDIVSTIEKRAKDMRHRLDQSDTPPVAETVEREEWMTVPDTSRKNQLGAISRCLAPGAPKEKSKHKKHSVHSERDKRTAEELKKYNKSKRSESLLEMHKKDKKKDISPDRRTQIEMSSITFLLCLIFVVCSLRRTGAFPPPVKDPVPPPYQPIPHNTLHAMYFDATRQAYAFHVFAVLKVMMAEWRKAIKKVVLLPLTSLAR